jgi:hypothetical protein
MRGLLLCLVLTSCSQESANRSAAIGACEKFVKSTFKRPETYRRLAASYRQEVISIPAYKKMLGNEKFSESDEFWIGLWAEHGGQVGLVTLDSYGENGLGAEVGGRDTCVFRLIDGRVNDADRDADLMISLRETDRLLGSLPGSPTPQYSCCIAPRPKN